MASHLNQPHFQDPVKAREYLEAIRWPDGVVTCPTCGQRNRVPYGRDAKCGKCGAPLSGPAEPIEIPSAEAFDALVARAKDLGLIMESSRALGVPLPATAANISGNSVTTSKRITSPLPSRLE